MQENNGFGDSNPILRQPSAAVVRGDQRQTFRFNDDSPWPLQDGDGNGRLELVRHLHGQTLDIY